MADSDTPEKKVLVIEENEPHTEELQVEVSQQEEPQPDEVKAPESQPEELVRPEPQPEKSNEEKPQLEETKPMEPQSEEMKVEELEHDEPKPSSRPPRTKVYSVDPSEPVDLLIGDTELTAAEPITLGQMFKSTRDKYPDYPALQYKEEEGGKYRPVTYSQYYDICVRVAKSFLKLELEPFHGVGILGFNAPEWFYSSLGSVFAGGLGVGIYPTSSPEACQFILENSKANIVVVENDKQLQKILEVRDQLPNLKAIVQYKEELTEKYPDVYEWSQFLELGESIDSQVVEDKIANLKPDQCAVLIYTSGTTGKPKGVMLSHDNITWTCKIFAKTYSPIYFGKERGVSYLPLSHIVAQFIDMYMMIYSAGTTYFAQPDALKGTLHGTLLEVNPTFFVAVPRIWEKFMGIIKSNAPPRGLKRRVASWAKDKSLQGHRNMMENSPVPWGWTVATMVLKKIRAAIGLSQARILSSAGAPIRQEVVEFFMGINMPLVDSFGMSEITGPGLTTIIEPGKFRLGSVGRPYEGLEIKLDYSASPEEGQGEICYRSRSVMMGYLGNEEKTKDAIDSEGWLHSGDLGTVDEDGFYYITGRIKELIITSGGENVAPVPIEERIKNEVPFLSNVFLVGEQRHYLTCLLTLQCVIDPDTQGPTDDLTPEAIQEISVLGSPATKVSEVIQNQDRAVFTAIEEGINRANEGAVSNAQKVKKWTLLDVDFSIPGGELGPTLKTKRFFVLKKYKETIDGMYCEP